MQCVDATMLHEYVKRSHPRCTIAFNNRGSRLCLKTTVETLVRSYLLESHQKSAV
jgi:hypothetical protein